MNLDDDLPLMLYTNLGTAEEPRRRVQNVFLDEELVVERMAAMAAEWVRRVPEGQTRQSFADGLTLRTALRLARKRGAEAVLVFSDAAVLEAGFREKVAALRVPEDWGMLVFGREGEGSPGVVPVRVFSDWTAVAVRRACYAEVARLLKRERTGRVRWMMGQRCAVPEGMKVYAVRPALVGSAEGEKKAAVGTAAPH